MKLIFLSVVAMSTILLAADGASLYKACASCHGTTGEKKALNKSKVINTFTKEEIVSALNGYKDGSCGGSMKALMKTKVAHLSESDIDSIAEYISAK